MRTVNLNIKERVLQLARDIDARGVVFVCILAGLLLLLLLTRAALNSPTPHAPIVVTLISLIACSIVGWLYLSLRHENNRLKEQNSNLHELFNEKGTIEQLRIWKELKQEAMLTSQVKQQRAVIAIGVGLEALMLLCPPWKNNHYRHLGITLGGNSAGYHWVFLPPSSDINVDVQRLILQCLFVAILVAGFVVWSRMSND